MTNLAIANLWHHKLRTALTALAVAVAVAMLVTMLSLSHGTLREVARRVRSVDADVVVLPRKSSVIFSDGAPLSDKYLAKFAAVGVDGRPLVARAIPVFLSVIGEMAGQQQRVFGIDPGDFDAFAGDRKIVSGEVFPGAGEFKSHVEALPKTPGGYYRPDQVSDAVLAAAQEMIIDQRLAAAGKYAVGDHVDFLGRRFRICGIVEQGLAGRVFVSIHVLRHIQNAGMAWSSLYFLQLDRTRVRSSVEKNSSDDGRMTVAQAAAILNEATSLRVEPLENYDQMLFRSFRSIYVFINIANLIVLVVSFLFIMVTIYTMVLERRRQIGILRSLGASGAYIMRLTIFEAMTISMAGTGVGIALAVGAKYLIEHYRPLLTVDVRPRWVLIAVAVGIIGGLGSALYPGYRALRLDPVECLAYE